MRQKYKTERINIRIASNVKESARCLAILNSQNLSEYITDLIKRDSEKNRNYMLAQKGEQTQA